MSSNVKQRVLLAEAVVGAEEQADQIHRRQNAANSIARNGSARKMLTTLYDNS